MAEAPKKNDKPATAAAADTTAGARPHMGVRLAPVDNSDQAVLANYTNINIAPGGNREYITVVPQGDLHMISAAGGLVVIEFVNKEITKPSK